MKTTIFLLLTSLFILSSCKTIQNIAEIKKKKATIHSYTINDKEIKYIPMHHIGKPIFYENVKAKVIDLKKQGYTVYYELVVADKNIDSIQNDTYKRKLRKIKGHNGSYKENMNKLGILKKYVQQPAYELLGTDNNDIRADATSAEFIIEWEKQNGAIILDSIDLNTNYDTTYSRKKFYTKKQRSNLIIGFRNAYLINKIISKNDNKILILYGAGHRKDLEKKILHRKI